MDYLVFIIAGSAILSLCAAFYTVTDAYLRINDHGDFAEDNQAYMKTFDVLKQDRGIDKDSFSV